MSTNEHFLNMSEAKWRKEECQWTYLCFLPLLHTLIICTHVLFSSLISSALCYSFQRCTNYELQFFHVIFDKGWSAIWLYVKVFVLHMPQTRTRMLNFRTFRPAFLLKMRDIYPATTTLVGRKYGQDLKNWSRHSACRSDMDPAGNFWRDRPRREAPSLTNFACINQDLMLAGGETFENSSIVIDFGALFQQSGNNFCKMHLPRHGSMPVVGYKKQ